MDGILQFDWNIMTWLQDNWHVGENPALDSVFKFITTLGDGGMIWIALGIVMLFFKKLRPFGIAVLLGAAFSGLLNDLIIKPIISRERPFDFDWPQFITNGREFFYPHIIKEMPHSLSFPSGHTSSSVAPATALWFISDKKLRWRLAIPFSVIALLIGFSRIYIHVHFPTDVLGGIVAGIVYGVLAVFAAKGIVALIKKIKPNTKLV
ncbi:MAG: phosphatase PAP2 family protein [Oscillospiraceae bacterium]|nr:phosphatase PAP2 family protein [Oscillospiraceae bacterium]